MARRCTTLALALALAGTAVAASTPAGAVTLEQVLARVYAASPRLEAARAGLRAVDEAVPLARAARRPSLTLRSSGGIDAPLGGGGGGDLLYPNRQSLDLVQPVYTGGEAAAAAARAESLVLAERARLGLAEQDVLLEAVQAYTAVARDQAVLARARENERRLRTQLAAARDQLRFGDATRTDVSQAEARAAGGTDERLRAEDDLAASSEAYARVAGDDPPGALDLPEAPALGDETVDDAQAEAEAAFAADAARFDAAAADAGVRAARAAFRPHLSITGGLGYASDDTASAPRSRADAQLGATLQVPLYQGGAEYARLRQSREVSAQRRGELDEAVRTARAQAATAWRGARNLAARLLSLEAQADRSAFALEGVRQEALAGARSVLDVLDAEAELYRAEVSLIRAQRERVVAAYRLRAATGRLTAAALGLDVTPYDPRAHYRAVRDRWFGVSAAAAAR